jgi:hypothetical protein
MLQIEKYRYEFTRNDSMYLNNYLSGKEERRNRRKAERNSTRKKIKPLV